MSNDDEATPEQVQAALDTVEAREGPDFPGWSRINPELTRKMVWEILCDVPKYMRETRSDARRRLYARNVRKEFGVRGEKPALVKPLVRRKRKVETWE